MATTPSEHIDDLISIFIAENISIPKNLTEDDFHTLLDERFETFFEKHKDLFENNRSFLEQKVIYLLHKAKDAKIMSTKDIVMGVLSDINKKFFE